MYEAEIEIDEAAVTQKSDRFRVVKFYRPGRWNYEQLKEEHNFLAELLESEVPVVAPLPLEAGDTVGLEQGAGIYFSVFPKASGRIDDELSFERLEIIGRLIARLHIVGARKRESSRLTMTPELYYPDNITFLETTDLLPQQAKGPFLNVAREILSKSSKLFQETALLRMHGDCHYGNILWSSEGTPFFVDFDDMGVGPAIQDMWLICGNDEVNQEIFLEAYGTFREFDRSELELKDPLRALRLIHYSAWIAKRWEDPAFKRIFTNFGSLPYWQEQTGYLEDLLALIN